MKKIKKNNHKKTILAVLILSAMSSGAANATNKTIEVANDFKEKYVTNILIHSSQELDDPWEERAKYFDNTINDFREGLSGTTVSDVAWAQQFMGIAIPNRVKDPDLNELFDGDPYFKVHYNSTSSSIASFEGHAPLNVTPQLESTLNFRFFIKDTDNNIIKILNGKTPEFDTLDLKDGYYIILMEVYNNSSTVQSLPASMKIDNFGPIIPDIEMVVGADLIATVNLSGSLEADTDYEWSLMDERGNVLETLSVHKGIDSDLLDPEIAFDMSQRPKGYYRISVLASDGIRVTEKQTALFDLNNLAPAFLGVNITIKNSDDGGATDRISLLTPGDKVDIRRGEKLGLYFTKTEDPEKEPIMYGVDYVSLATGEVVASDKTGSLVLYSSTIALEDGDYLVRPYVTDGVNIVHESFSYPIHVFSSNPLPAKVSVKEKSPLVYSVNSTMTNAEMYEGFKIAITLQDLEGNVLNSGESSALFDMTTYPSGDYEIVAKIYHPNDKSNHPLVSYSFPTSIEGDEVSIESGQTYLHNFINTPPAPSLTLDIDYSDFGFIKIIPNPSTKDPQGVSLDMEYDFYEKDTDNLVYSTKNKAPVLPSLFLPKGTYDVVGYASDHRFNIDSVGNVSELPETKPEYIAGSSQVEITTYDATEVSEPIVIAWNYYDKLAYVIPEVNIPGLKWGDSSTKVHFSISDPDTGDIIMEQDVSMPMHSHSVYYWQPDTMRDMTVNLNVTVTSEGKEYKSTIPYDLFNYPPGLYKDFLYEKTDTTLKFRSPGAEPLQWNPVSLINLVAKDKNGEEVVNTELLTSDGFNFAKFDYDVSSLPDGEYSFTYRIKDAFKYSEFKEPRTINIINVLPNAVQFDASYDEKGFLDISVVENHQPELWETTGFIDYFIHVIKKSTGEEVYKKKGLTHHIPMASYYSDDYDIYFSTNAKANEDDPSYDYIVNSPTKTITFVNEDPIVGEFEVTYDSENLLAKIIDLGENLDKENGTLRTYFQVVRESDGVEVYRGGAGEIDARLFKNGAYTVVKNVDDERPYFDGTVKKTISNAFVVNNAPVTVPDIIAHQNGVFLNIQISGAIDPEQKPLNFKMTFTHENGESIVKTFNTPSYSIDLSKWPSGNVQIDLEISDGVNVTKASSDIDYINTPPIFDFQPEVEDMGGHLEISFHAVDNEQSQLGYDLKLTPPEGGKDLKIGRATSGFLSIDYSDQSPSDGTYSLKVTADDGYYKVDSETVTFDLINTPPYVEKFVTKQSGMTVDFSAIINDRELNPVTGKIIIYDADKNVLAVGTDGSSSKPSKEEGMVIGGQWDAVSFKTGEYTIHSELTDLGGASSTEDDVFTLINTPPSMPLFTYKLQDFFNLTLTGFPSEDLEGEEVTYFWNLYDSEGNILEERFSEDLSTILDLSKYQTGTYLVSLSAFDGANTVESKRESIGVQNEPPGTPVFSTVQSGFDLDLFGYDYVDPEGVELTYDYIIIKQDDPSVSFESSSTNKDASFSTEAWPNGVYEIKLILSDGASEAYSPTTIINVYNAPPQATSVSAKVYGEYVAVKLSPASDPEGKIVSYESQVFNKDDLDTPIFEAKGRSFSIPASSLKTGEYVIVAKTFDGGQYSMPSTGEFSFVNELPSTPVFDILASSDGIHLEGQESSDINGDPLTYYYDFVYSDTGDKFVFADGADLGRNKIVDYQDLKTGNGKYIVTYYASDGVNEKSSVPKTFIMDYQPAILSASISVNDYFEGVEYDPSQVIRAVANYKGNTDKSPVTYQWSVDDGDVVKSETEEGTADWKLPASHGKHTINVTLKEKDTAKDVVASFDVIVKNYPPELKDYVVANGDGVFSGEFENTQISNVDTYYWNTLNPSTSFTGEGSVIGMFSTANELNDPAFNPQDPDVKILSVSSGNGVIIDMKKPVKPALIGLSLANVGGGDVANIITNYDIYYSYDGVDYTKLTHAILYPGDSQFPTLVTRYDETYSYFPSSDSFTTVVLNPDNSPTARYWKVERKLNATGSLNLKLFFKF